MTNEFKPTIGNHLTGWFFEIFRFPMTPSPTENLSCSKDKTDCGDTGAVIKEIPEEKLQVA